MDDSLQDVLKRLDFAATTTGGRKFQTILLGDSGDIYEAMHSLHVRGYAEVALWSPLLPIPNSTQWISILTRYRSI